MEKDVKKLQEEVDMNNAFLDEDGGEKSSEIIFEDQDNKINYQKLNNELEDLEEDLEEDVDFGQMLPSKAKKSEEVVQKKRSPPKLKYNVKKPQLPKQPIIEGSNIKELMKKSKERSQSPTEI